MVRLILLTDFTEAFPHNLLQGILKYAKEKAGDAWVVCRMPPSYKDQYGIEGVLQWAKNWKANAIIGRFNNNEDVNLFAQNGITAVAQDFKQRFTGIPNITSDYKLTGTMAAHFFLERGFKHFAFYGYENTIWSDERCEGYYNSIERAGYAQHFYAYTNQQLETLWYYDTTPLVSWLRSLPPHTALFCCDDNQGNKITEVCKFSGIRIPQDIAVLGVDNDQMICELSDPPLSSIHLDIKRGGYAAAELIDRLMQHPQTPRRDIIIQPTTIISRASTNIYATDDQLIGKTLDYIHKNLYTPLRVNHLLKMLPLSRRLLEIRFKQVTGKTIYSYILDNRMELFARLLQETSKPINELAIEMGFNNYGNLTRQFKRIKHCTPTEYRKQNKVNR